MTPAPARPTVVAMTPEPLRRDLLTAAAALVTIDLTGAVVAVADDLASAGDALTSGTYLSAPGPMIAVQALCAAGAARSAGRAGTIAGGLLVAVCTLSLSAAAFDGDVGHAGVSTAEVLLQTAGVAATIGLWLAAFARIRRARRARPSAAPGSGARASAAARP